MMLGQGLGVHPNTPLQFLETDLATELALNCPTKKVNAAFDKWVKPRMLNDWKHNIPMHRPKPPQTPTEAKLEWIQLTIIDLKSKPSLLPAESKWLSWAVPRIEELKFEGLL